MTIKTTWRDDPGLIFETEYKKKFAWWPVHCLKEEKRIWLRPYYSYYMNWGHSYGNHPGKKGLYESWYHQDFIGNLTEQEYLVRKLADTL